MPPAPGPDPPPFPALFTEYLAALNARALPALLALLATSYTIAYRGAPLCASRDAAAEWYTAHMTTIAGPAVARRVEAFRDGVRAEIVEDGRVATVAVWFAWEEGAWKIVLHDVLDIVPLEEEEREATATATATAAPAP